MKNLFYHSLILLFYFILIDVSPSFSQTIHRVGEPNYLCGTAVDQPTLDEDGANLRSTTDRSCPMQNECWGFGHNSCASNAPVGCPYRIPIVYHILRETNGSGGITTALLDADFAAMNAIFSSMNIEFYESAPRNYINNSSLYDFETYNDELNQLFLLGAYKPNAVNIYIVDDGVETGTAANPFSLCGQAPYPGGKDWILMNRTCMGNAETTAHEFGHYFGVRHTHTGPTGRSPRTVQEQPNNTNSTGDYCDCWNSGTGDGIGDTPPDPIINEGCGGANCIINTACNLQHTPGNGPAFDASDCSGGTFGVNLGDYNPMLTNIMNYNYYGSCNANQFTACQQAKMVDVLTCCRTYLCCPDPLNNLAAPYTDYYEICEGDALPIFEAASACYEWFDAATGGNMLFSGDVFNIPTSGAGAVNNTVGGLYEFWLGQANPINPDCRTKVTLRILPDAGVGEGDNQTGITACGANNYTFVSNMEAIDNCQVIGWWVTENNPISATATTESAIQTALNNATIGGPITGAANNIFASSTSTPDEDEIPIDCDQLNSGSTYYITPFVSYDYQDIAPITLDCNNTANICGSSIPLNFTGCDDPFEGGKFMTGPIAGAPVNTNCLDAPIAATWDLELTINDLGNCSLADGVTIWIRSDDGNNQRIFLQDIVVSPPQIITITDAYCPSYDPTNGFKIFIYGEDDFCCGEIPFDVDLTINYPGVTGETFPSVEFEGTNVNATQDCIFGTPVSLNCSCNCPTANDASGLVDICSGGTVSASDITTATIATDPNGTGRNVIYAYDENTPGDPTSGTSFSFNTTSFTNTSCVPIDVVVYAYIECESDVNNPGIDSYVAAGSFTVTVYPTLSIDVTDDGTTCGTPSVDLVAADNTVCATQTQAAACVDNNDGFNYDFGTDASDDAYDGTWIINAPTACAATVDGTVNCSNCALACPTANNASGMVDICSGGTVAAADITEATVATDPDGTAVNIIYAYDESTPGDPNTGTSFTFGTTSFMNTTCAPIDVVVNAYIECDNDSDNPGVDAYVTAASFTITIYPTLTTTITDDGTTCGVPSVDLVAADNTICATQSKANSCVDNNDSFAYDFGTDASDDGYDGTWIANAPTACASMVTGTINCNNCILDCPTANAAAGVVDICSGGTVAASDITEASIANDPVGTAGNVVYAYDEGTLGDPTSGTAFSFGTTSFSNMTCAPIDVVVNAYIECDNDSNSPGVDVYVAAGSFTITVYPTLTTDITDDGTTCATPSVDLVAMDNTICATQSRGTACADDGDSFAYDFGTDTSDDGYDGTWIANAPTACTSTVTGMITCSNCVLDCPTVNDAGGTVGICSDGTVAIADITEATIASDPDVTAGNVLYVYDEANAGDPTSGTAFSFGTTSFSNMTCMPMTMEILAYVECDNDSNNPGIDEYIVAGSFEIIIYPITSIQVIDDGSTCETPEVALLQADGSVCASQTGNLCLLNGDAFNYDFATGTFDDGYDGTWIPNAPTACSPSVNGTLTCTGCICDLAAEVVIDNGNQGSTSPFYYNIAFVDVFEGTPPYYYAWSTSGYVRHAIVNAGDPVIGGEKEVKVEYADNAVWTVTITDWRGCETIVSNDPDLNGDSQHRILDIVGHDITPDNCINRATGEGAITLYLEHGTPPHSYEWAGPNNWTNPGILAGAVWTGGNGIGESLTLEEVPYGWYSVTVTDSGDDRGPYDDEGNPIIDGDPDTPLPQQYTEGWYWVPCGRTGGRGKLATDIPLLEIAPNPIQGATQITFNLPEADEVVIELFTMDGKKVLNLFEGHVEGNNWQEMSFQPGPLMAGIYLIRLKTNRGIVLEDRVIIL